MLTKKQISWKTESNALKWCKLKGYRFLHIGAFDVFYVSPEQEGKKMKGLGGEIESYSSINWIDVFSDLELE